MAEFHRKQLQAFEQICPASFKKPLRVQGDQQKLGRIETYLYMRPDHTASYSVSTLPFPAKGDPCQVTVEEVITMRLAKYDGRRTLIWSFDARTHQGSRRVVNGRSPLLDTAGQELAGAAAFSSLSKPQGSGSVIAGASCEVRVHRTAAFITEVCQLRDKRLPAAIQGFPLRSVHKSKSGELISEFTVTEFETNAEVDIGVFELPSELKEEAEQ